jgi:hypothetical protein
VKRSPVTGFSRVWPGLIMHPVSEPVLGLSMTG